MPEGSGIISQQVEWTDPGDWHNQITIETREQIFGRVWNSLLRKIGNLLTLANLSSEQFLEIKEISKWIENQSFIMGTSRYNYYHLIDTHLNKTPDELKESFIQYNDECRRNLYLIERRVTKPWHESFTSNLRKTIISTFVDEIISSNDRALLPNSSEQRLIMLASRAEAKAYDAATSRAEYYEILGKKIGQTKYQIDDLMQQARDLRYERRIGFTFSAIYDRRNIDSP